MIELEALAPAGGPVRHGFFTRLGGVGAGLYDSLNCGPGSRDDPAVVAANRARCAAALGCPDAPVLTAHQVHSAEAVVVETPFDAEARPRADGLATKTPGLVIGVLTADCAPVLFADAEAGVIGAAHAGWKGAFDGVLEATVEAMVGIGANRGRITAAIGPCIGQDSYEVGAEFEARFLAADPTNNRFFVPGDREGHPMFDLLAYVRSRLRAADIDRVEAVYGDTCAMMDMFFSYRRSVLMGEPDYGRQLSAIALAD